MRTIKNFVFFVITLSILFCFSVPINAVSSTLYVNAGGNAYTSETSTTTQTRKSCYISLTSVKFLYHPQNHIPPSYYVYAVLCTPASSHPEATITAGFSTVGNGYYYNYKTGYGGNGQSYVLKSYSNLNIYYSAGFSWNSNGELPDA